VKCRDECSTVRVHKTNHTVASPTPSFPNADPLAVGDASVPVRTASGLEFTPALGAWTLASLTIPSSSGAFVLAARTPHSEFWRLGVLRSTDDRVHPRPWRQRSQLPWPRVCSSAPPLRRFRQPGQDPPQRDTSRFTGGPTPSAPSARHRERPGFAAWPTSERLNGLHTSLRRQQQSRRRCGPGAA
jgi:hypothetical protein